MNVLRITASMDPAMGGPPQGIRNSIAELERLGIRNEAVCCDAPDAAWLGKDSFPVHALGPGKYGFAYTPKLGPWLEENLPRFDAVIVHGLWLWPSVCATRAVARERARRKEQKTGHGLTRMKEDRSERLAADRTGGGADCRMTSTAGGLSSEKSDVPESLNAQPSTFNSKQLRCFVMPHGMLDPWFQRDKSRRVKAVRNWFYWWLVERGVVNSADALLFTCQQELELARTTFGGYRPKREINVGYGIAEPPAFEPKMQEAFAARCPDLNGRPYLLFMSRVHPKKGVDLLVRAYARVRGEVLRGLKDQETKRLKDLELPDLVVAGPSWDSDYGREVRGLIDEANRSIASTEQRTLPTANSACVHAVDMLQGDAKWGALYGCEAFVLPSHQENFGIAVVEALACGKLVLISDQVNIWREIVDDGAGLGEEDTEEGVEKLLRKFFERPVTSEELRVTRGTPRECYLKRFAIGPAVALLARALQEK
jgi:glycosyltransferase involved in cell wall biosynthesis